MPLKYTKEHEWIKIENDIVAIGITKHAAEALGTLVFVELPTVGTQVNIGDSCGVVESAKSASDVYSPVSGEIVEINTKLDNEPELVNNSNEGTAWICKIKISNKNELESCMSKIEYEAFIQR